ncbi:hypothetical protein MPK66_gp196 [Erwinia phage pEa_SNUABM_2]|uniref:Uncharacterized protein n=1 Tax=Erwinia phage pEa_SNUABM_2 TaxID=2869547 RepID=A0AAE8C188_9CAUD|nr:hypothetical protein MPK66_gp196 [Erwinia phage pEa_SNUABM_2]QZE59440.1 hypothetical protein pEaSNUABM2_00196 [Erwinia phage pEa_SNUABM_2]QZE59776.1 hypothetical protein pEaSNUABM39_00196 [Erwinia phage pEa_SNUABM_39]
MAMIKIALASAIASESAKKPSYKFVVVNRVSTIVVPTSKKSVVQGVANIMKGVRTSMIAHLDAKTKAAKLLMQSGKLLTKNATDANKQKSKTLRAQAKEQRELASAKSKEFREGLRNARAELKKGGLSALAPELNEKTVSDQAPAFGTAVGRVKARKSNKFTVTGRTGSFGVKFVSDSKFDAISAAKKESRGAGLASLKAGRRDPFRSREGY